MKNRKFLTQLTLSLFASMILVGCGTQTSTKPATTQASQKTNPEPASVTEAPTEAPATTVSFANDVLPIIQSRCVNCHGGQRIEKGLLMNTYDEIMAGSDNGPVVIPGDVEGSLLVELVTANKMPKRGPKLTPQQIQVITDWVAAGALNN